MTPRPRLALALVAALTASLAACGLVQVPEAPVVRPTRTPDPVAAIPQRFPADPDLPNPALTTTDAFLTAGSRTVALGRIQSDVPRPGFRYSDDGGATWSDGALTATAHNATRVGETPTGLGAVKPGDKPLWLQLGVLDDALFAWISTDGASWTRTDVSGLGLKAVTYTAMTATSAGFVLVGAKYPAGAEEVPTVWRSTDGVAWVEVPMGARGIPYAVVARGTKLVAVGSNELLQRDEKDRACVAHSYYSADAGQTWTSSELPTPPGAIEFCSTAAAVAATDSGFVAGGSAYADSDRSYHPTFFTSPDGVRWTAGPAPKDGTGFAGLAASGTTVLGSVRVRTEGSTTNALVRYDGTGWVTVPAPVKGLTVVSRLAGSPSGFLLSLVDRSGPTDTAGIWRSPDGLAIQPATVPQTQAAAEVAVWSLVVGADKVRRAFGLTQNKVAMWQVDATGAGSYPAILATGRQYEAIGAASGKPGTVVYGSERVAGSTQAVVWFSPDGASFKRTPDANLRIPGAYGFTEINQVLWAGDRWVAVGGESSNGDVRRSALVYTSTTGTDWRKGVAAATYGKGDGYSDTDPLTDLAGLDGRARTMEAVTAVGTGLVAVGWTTEAGATKGAVWRSADRQTWTLSSLPAPEAAVSWSATRVASIGSTVVATGWSTVKDSDHERYHVWTSTDGGATWSVAKSVDSTTDRGFFPVALGQRVVALQESKDGSALVAWVASDGKEWQSNPVTIPELRPGVKVSVTSATVEDDHLLLLVTLTGPTAKRTVVVSYTPPA